MLAIGLFGSIFYLIHNRLSELQSKRINEKAAATAAVKAAEDQASEEKQAAKQRVQAAEDVARHEAHKKAQLAQLRKFSTSTSASIRGHRLVRQVRMISISDHTDQDTDDIRFLQEVQDAGANGVINMRIRRHRGGYISITGDAVALE